MCDHRNGPAVDDGRFELSLIRIDANHVDTETTLSAQAVNGSVIESGQTRRLMRTSRVPSLLLCDHALRDHGETHKRKSVSRKRAHAAGVAGFSRIERRFFPCAEAKFIASAETNAAVGLSLDATNRALSETWFGRVPNWSGFCR